MRVGQPVVVMEAMKMEHVIESPRRRRRAPGRGRRRRRGLRGPSAGVHRGGRRRRDGAAVAEEVDLDAIRPDLAEVHGRHAIAHARRRRPDAVARRRETGQRTARENIDDLCDPGTFVEYGALAVAAQRRRRPVRRADRAHARPTAWSRASARSTASCSATQRARCVVMSYDYTVLAGTQGPQNHRKKDRMFELAERVAAAGGVLRRGRRRAARRHRRPRRSPGSTRWPFTSSARLSGLVPLVGITSGRCFAGNAALLGCCDVDHRHRRTRTSAWAARR